MVDSVVVYNYLQEDEWNLFEAIKVMCYVDIYNPPPEMRQSNFVNMQRMQENWTISHVRYNKEFNNELIMNCDNSSVFVKPELFVEWTYSEGYITPMHEFYKDVEYLLGRKLKRYSFGRYMQFYEKWAKKGYWTSNEAVSLIINEDPENVGVNNEGIQAINGSYNYDTSSIEIGNEMERDVAAGVLQTLDSKIPNQRKDIFKPIDIITWAEKKGYDICELLLNAIGKNPTIEKIKKYLQELSKKDGSNTLVNKDLYASIEFKLNISLFLFGMGTPNTPKFKTLTNENGFKRKQGGGSKDIDEKMKSYLPENYQRQKN